jgi:hypothetical protein
VAEHSCYELVCDCGIQYRVRHEGTFQCRCGRILELDWSYAAREAASAAHLKKIDRDLKLCSPSAVGLPHEEGS